MGVTKSYEKIKEAASTAEAIIIEERGTILNQGKYHGPAFIQGPCKRVKEALKERAEDPVGQRVLERCESAYLTYIRDKRSDNRTRPPLHIIAHPVPLPLYYLNQPAVWAELMYTSYEKDAELPMYKEMVESISNFDGFESMISELMLPEYQEILPKIVYDRTDVLCEHYADVAKFTSTPRTEILRKLDEFPVLTKYDKEIVAHCRKILERKLPPSSTSE